MSTVPKRLLTAAEYLQRERSAEFKSEFFEGEMFAMAAANRRHSLICSNLVAFLRPRLRSYGSEVHGSDIRVKVSTTGLYTYPDASIARSTIEFEDEHDDVLLNPVGLFEVLSPSTAVYDCGIKSRHYRLFGSLLEFLLIDQNVAFVDHFVRENCDTWRVTNYSGLAASVPLQCIHSVLPLTEVYANIQFDPAARPLHLSDRGTT